MVGGIRNAADDSFAGLVGAAAVMFAFVTLNLTVLKRLSFQETIKGIQPTWTASDSAACSEAVRGDGAAMDIRTRCDSVARRKRLTPRETEIFMMLARGRNVPFIQEKLVLSRNTVKTHVSNIYGKLGVHSQQDLIDMVEEELE